MTLSLTLFRQPSLSPVVDTLPFSDVSFTMASEWTALLSKSAPVDLASTRLLVRPAHPEQPRHVPCFHAVVCFESMTFNDTGRGLPLGEGLTKHERKVWHLHLLPY